MIPLSLEIKVIAAVGLLLALVGGASYWHHSVYDQGEIAGRAAVQKLWNENKKTIQATADAAIAKANQERDEAQRANEVISHDYETKILAARADAVSLAQRLRDAAARLAANSRATDKAGGQSATPGASAPASDGVLTSAVAGVFEECNANSDQLDALIAEIKPQL